MLRVRGVFRHALPARFCVADSWLCPQGKVQSVSSYCPRRSSWREGWCQTPVWYLMAQHTNPNRFLFFYTWMKTSSESFHMLFDSCLMSLGRNKNSKSFSIKSGISWAIMPGTRMVTCQISLEGLSSYSLQLSLECVYNQE